MASTTESPRRGDVWLVSFGAARSGEPGKNRPAAVVSADDLLVGSNNELIVVVPITASLAPSPLRPPVGMVEGVDRDSAAVPRAIRAVSRSRLLRRLGRLSDGTLSEVSAALRLVLALEDGVTSS